MNRTIGEAFAQALAAKDSDRLRGLLAPEVDFQGLTPGRHWSATTPGEVVDGVVLGRWFGDGSRIRELLSVTTGRVGDCEHVAYRLRVRNANGGFVVEQQAYYTVDSGQIGWMRVLCSGYRPESPVTACEMTDHGSRRMVERR
jgi:hypothetical protein